MRTIKVQLYKFPELCFASQEVAIEDYLLYCFRNGYYKDTKETHAVIKRRIDFAQLAFDNDWEFTFNGKIWRKGRIQYDEQGAHNG